jgi:cytochrome c peroxidase
VLFYDGHLSINNAVSCGSCHKQTLGFADNKTLSVGFEGRLTKRNSIGFNNISFGTTLFWDGRENNLANLALRPLTNHVEMGITDEAYLPAKLSALSYYTPLFLNAFGDNQVTNERISNAIATFLRSISSNNSRFDQYNNGNKEAMTALEIQGMSLFSTKYNCASCHSSSFGGYYGFNNFKDIGLDENYADNGRGTVSANKADQGTFRIPNLRNVALTAPYMHDGRYATLNDVLEHYSHNIKSSPNLDPLLKDKDGKARAMNISDNEKLAIIAFLNTFTDYTTVADPKFSNPFKVID